MMVDVDMGSSLLPVEAVEHTGQWGGRGACDLVCATLRMVGWPPPPLHHDSRSTPGVQALRGPTAYFYNKQV